MDAVPGRLNEVITCIGTPGSFFGQCSEICGVGHGFMPTSIVAKVVPEFSVSEVLEILIKMQKESKKPFRE